MTTNEPESTATAIAPQGVKPHRQIKLGVDVHWRQYDVVRQIDGASPQSPQRFKPEEFVTWAKKQTQLADEVHCCYEAGPFGFVLHKRLVALGVKSLVVRPRNWDEYSKKVKTDRRDALALLSSLDRYLAGNKEALTVIRVPSDDEEKARSDTRQREQLPAERKRFGAQGLSTARYYGYDLPEEWWRAKRFAALREELPEFLFTLQVRLFTAGRMSFSHSDAWPVEPRKGFPTARAPEPTKRWHFSASTGGSSAGRRIAAVMTVADGREKPDCRVRELGNRLEVETSSAEGEAMVRIDLSPGDAASQPILEVEYRPTRGTGERISAR